MGKDEITPENSVEETGGPESPARRVMLRRLAKGGAVIPVAAVVFNSSKSVAAASP